MNDRDSTSTATGIAVAASDRTRVRSFALEVIAGPGQGTRYTAAGERTVIGTHDRSDFMLADRTVSRLHCEIVCGDGRPRLRDLGSRNGTRIDGVKVVDAFLLHGQVIEVGTTRIAFRDAAEELEIPLAASGRFGGLIGRSAMIRGAFALLERAAASDATVLLGGETGTGKEAAARAIHAHGPRAGGPFVVVDCAAIPPTLLESELFGHEAGAFTGAEHLRRGAFEDADGGTIFLDEIGELALNLQPKLLRALEERSIKRVGASAYRAIDVRVITATHRDLAVEVNAQRFRSDLYYRLAVIEVRLPALRDRPEDLPDLVDHFLGALGAAEDDARWLRSSDVLASLARHAWPGNVRELRNYVERCLALKSRSLPHAHRVAEPLTADDGPPAGAAPADRAAVGLDRDTVVRSLGEHGGHIGRTAAALGVHRRTLERRIRALGLR